ncbi:GNAT family N-acetyltransferase [Rubritalea tangerina]|uniref:GNAT family N-acetyltransferase n=1 Tax=Rubritalea tangerina TaxID=430798 RepID=UPI0036118ED3
MPEQIKIELGTAPPCGGWVKRVTHLLQVMDGDFKPKLSKLVNISDYAQKLCSNANVYMAVHGSRDIGMIAFYVNNEIKGEAFSFISTVCVTPESRGGGVAQELMQKAYEHSVAVGCKSILLEVSEKNDRAVKLYKKSGFYQTDKKGSYIGGLIYRKDFLTA